MRKAESTPRAGPVNLDTVLGFDASDIGVLPAGVPHGTSSALKEPPPYVWYVCEWEGGGFVAGTLGESVPEAATRDAHGLPEEAPAASGTVSLEAVLSGENVAGEELLLKGSGAQGKAVREGGNIGSARAHLWTRVRRLCAALPGAEVLSIRGAKAAP